MILSAWRVFRSLAWYHHVMIVITILVPLGWSVFITFWAPNCWTVLAAIHLGAFLLLFVLAEFAVGVALRRDKAKAQDFVFQEVETVSEDIRALREQQTESSARQENLLQTLRREIDEQEETFRSAFEELGVALPPRTVSIGFTVRSGRPTVSISVEVIPPSGRWARLLWRMRRCRQWAKEKIWRTPDPK